MAIADGCTVRLHSHCTSRAAAAIPGTHRRPKGSLLCGVHSLICPHMVGHPANVRSSLVRGLVKIVLQYIQISKISRLRREKGLGRGPDTFKYVFHGCIRLHFRYGGYVSAM